VDVGQTVAASLQAPTLFVIGQDLTKMQVDTNVDEADVGRVVLDQGVTFTVDSYPGQAFRGRVMQIRQSPQVIQNVVTYDVVVAVANPDLKLKPGMTANVRILVARKENALVLSNAAFRLRLQPPGAPGSDAAPAKRPAGGGPGGPGGPGGGPGAASARALAAAPQKLWVLKDGKPEERTVRTGLTDGQRTEVVEGLAEGEPVIVAVIRPGSGTAARPAGGPGMRF
jgi:HlyD family secretion protein